MDLVGPLVAPFRETPEEEPDLATRRRRIRQAFAEYLTLEPYLKRSEFAATRQISNDFRRLYRVVDDEVECRALAANIVEILRAALVRAAGGESS